MSIIIKLQGLPIEATSVDVRRYFLGLTIPDGGVHIVGGDEGTVFIEFASDEDARQAMARGDGNIRNSNIKLLLSSRNEMQIVTEAARQRQQQYLQQQQLQQQLQQQQQQQANLIHHQQQQQQNQQQMMSQHQQQQQQHSYLPNSTTSNTTTTTTTTTGVLPMGPALLPHSTPQPFENDPRLLSQSYQGVLNVMNRPQSPPKQQQQQLQPPQQPSPFVDPRILSQNYQGMMTAALNQQQQQQHHHQTQLQPQHTLLPQQAQIFNQFPPTSIATSNSNNLTLSLLGNIGLVGTGVGGLNSSIVGGGGLGGGVSVASLGGFVDNNTNLGNNNNNLDNSNGDNNNSSSNRNQSPDARARMSGMRGGDDKLFANKRCVLAASNIPYRATSKDIIEFLSEFNIKEDSIRRRYNQKGQPTADAKIAFPSPEAAIKALKIMNKKTLCGRPVFLKPV